VVLDERDEVTAAEPVLRHVKKQGRIASKTSGRKGVVALWLR
jgi:hypothetical protein